MSEEFEEFEEFEDWFVRYETRVTGPFTREQLKCRRERGELPWSHEVSQDQVVWISASSLGPVGTSDPLRRAASRRGGQALIALGAAILVLCGVGYLALPEQGDDPSEPPIANAQVAEAGPAPVNPAHTPPPIVLVLPPAPAPEPPAAAFPVARDIRSADAVDEVSRAVGLVIAGRTLVSPDGTRTEIPYSSGTCFNISTRGYLLTNRHVIESPDEDRISEKQRKEEKDAGLTSVPSLWVFYLQRPRKTLVKLTATVVFQTEHNDELDVAVLKIDPGPEGLPCYFRLGSPGENDGLKSREVYALGFPAAARRRLYLDPAAQLKIKLGMKIEDLFTESDFDYVPERGIVKVIRKEDGPTRRRVEWILHGAVISQGNSGGPLVALDGTAVGINTLVQHVKEDAVANYFALGTSQVRDLITSRIHELAEELGVPAAGTAGVARRSASHP